MAKRDIRIHFMNGEVEDFDSANLAIYDQDQLGTAGPPDPIPDTITNKTIGIMRQCVCRLEAGPDAYDEKELTLEFEYWCLDADGFRTGDRPVRFRLHIRWSSSTVYYDDVQLHYTGGASNKNPNASLGGTLSSFPVIPGLANAIRGEGLFDDILYDEHKPAGEGGSGDTEYRVIRLENFGSTTVDVDIWIENPDDVNPAEFKDSFGYDIQLAFDTNPFASAAADENTDPGSHGGFLGYSQDAPFNHAGLANGTGGLNIVLSRVVTVDP